jgi:hypothetical protein
METYKCKCSERKAEHVLRVVEVVCFAGLANYSLQWRTGRAVVTRRREL